MTTVPSPARLIEPRPSCATWCATHDDEGGVCLGEGIDLDFAEIPNRHGWLVSGLGVLLARSVEEGTNVSLSINGLGAADMTVEDAKRLAQALLQAVDLAEVDRIFAGHGDSVRVPTPRTSVDNTKQARGGAK
jgi:hypothetical protein